MQKQRVERLAKWEAENEQKRSSSAGSTGSAARAVSPGKTGGNADNRGRPKAKAKPKP